MTRKELIMDALVEMLVEPQTQAPSATDLAARLWTESLTREHNFRPLRIEGRVPEGLRGTLVRNGPGLFGQFGVRYSHPFEGDGALSAVRFAGAAPPRGAVKITKSAGLAEE